MLTDITWQEAQSRLLAWAQPIGSEAIPLRHSLFHFLSGDVPLQAVYPAHNLAADTGVAVHHASLKAAWERGELPRFRFGGNIGGARSYERQVHKDHAYHVTAGTLLPDLLDVVVDEAEAERNGNELVVSARPEQFEHIIPKGRFIPQAQRLLEGGRRVAYPGFASLYSQPIADVSVIRKPTLGSLILGHGLVDAHAEKFSESAVPELLSPIVSSMSFFWRFNFVPLGVQDAHHSIAETLLKASDQAEVLIISGILSTQECQELDKALAENTKVVISGIKHPLGGRFRAAQRDHRWIFVLPYNPPFIHAMFSLLIGPTVIRMLGEPYGWAPLAQGILAEPATAAEPDDDIWVGYERFSRDFSKQPEVKLLCQISKASLSSLNEGNCIVVPRTGDTQLEAGSRINMIRY
jgi:molybdopterin molybdotransferase